MNKNKSLVKNQKGQSIMEYIIISGLVGIFCLFAVKDFGKIVQNKITLMKKKISKEISVR